MESKQNVTRSYYMIGRRPLNNKIMSKYYGESSEKANLNPEHLHFVSPNGKNFGYGTLINDKHTNVFEESQEDLKKYAYDTKKFQQKKYDAECIDIARNELEKKWGDTIENVDLVPPFSGFPEKKSHFALYNMFTHNCQDFVDEVIEHAEKIAKKKGVPLIVEEGSQQNPPTDSSKSEVKQFRDLSADEIAKRIYPNMN